MRQRDVERDAEVGDALRHHLGRLRRPRDVQDDAGLRVRRVKAGRDIRQQVVGDTDRGGDGDDRPRRPALMHLVRERLGVLDRPPREARERAPGRGGDDTAGQPVEERGAHLPLQPGELAAHGGGRDEEATCRRVHRSRLEDGDEVLEGRVDQWHRMSPSRVLSGGVFRIHALPVCVAATATHAFPYCHRRTSHHPLLAPSVRCHRRGP